MVQEIGLVSFIFQNLDLGKASTDDKWHLQFLRLGLDNMHVYTKYYPSIPMIQEFWAIFSFSELQPRKSIDQ